MASPRAALVLVVALAACGHGSDGAAPAPPPPEHKDVAPRDAAPEFPSRALGMPDVASFQWRKRGGQAAYRAARKAEARKDWPAAIAAAREAIAADPSHLDAQWLLATAFASTGDHDAMVAPLQIAVAGDPGAWLDASLERGTPLGDAWRQRVEADRKLFIAALARAVVVVAAGDVYAFDPDEHRWYRLTHTAGAVTAAYRSDDDVIYVTRSKRGFAVGLVSLDTGHTTLPQRLAGAAAPIVIVRDGSAFFVGTGGAWRELGRSDGEFHKPPVKTRPPGDAVEVWNHTAKLHHKPSGKLKADWDDHMLASAMRVGSSERIVTVPSPGLIDGNTIVWAADQQHLAFVAQLDDHCTPGTASAAAFVADAATGTAHELERASGGIAIEWAGDGRVAIAGDHGVSLVSIEGGAPQPIEGADALATPRRKSKCAPEPADDAAAEDVEDSP